MQKLKRPKIIKSFLEGQIAKNQRRIEKLSEHNFELRKQLAYLESMTPQTPLTKADLEARDKATEPSVEDIEPVLDSADQEIGQSI